MHIHTVFLAYLEYNQYVESKRKSAESKIGK